MGAFEEVFVPMKTLVVVHVYYSDFWPELRTCLKNIPSPRDVIITYVDEAAVGEVRRDLPDARFMLSENRGFDIWPFLQAISSVNLSEYGCVVKLHTKRNIVRDYAVRFNHCTFNGAVWRGHLLSFCRTPEAWRKTMRELSRPGTGMVSDRHVIVRKRDFPSYWDSVHKCFDDAVAEIRKIPGGRAFRPSGAQYVSGTMFAARPEPLAFLLKRGFESEMFVASTHANNDCIVYAHIVENMLGLAVSAVGQRIRAYNGSLAWRRLYAPICNGLYRVKVTRRRRIVKVLGIPVSWMLKKEGEWA